MESGCVASGQVDLFVCLQCANENTVEIINNVYCMKVIKFNVESLNKAILKLLLPIFCDSQYMSSLSRKRNCALLLNLFLCDSCSSFLL